MSYTKSYLIDLINLETELEFILTDHDPGPADIDRILELESEIQQRKDFI